MSEDVEETMSANSSVDTDASSDTADYFPDDVNVAPAPPASLASPGSPASALGDNFHYSSIAQIPVFRDVETSSSGSSDEELSSGSGHSDCSI